MIDPVQEGIWNATKPYYPVTHTWAGEEVYEGDSVWILDSGEVVNDDVHDMKTYLMHRITVLGGIDKWVKEDLMEADSAAPFVLQLLEDGDTHQSLSLVDIFEDYYGGERTEAEADGE